jgi:hypothetical protein
MNMSSPPTASPLRVSSPCGNLDPMENHQGNQRQWQGTWTTGSQSHETQLSGPSSSSFFLTRLCTHIALSLQLSLRDYHMQPIGASNFLASPTVLRTDLSEAHPTAPDSLVAFENTTRPQEENFLALFWQSFHCTIPILNELEFKEHYESLWATPTPSGRKPSPLADIVLALCMQYGMTFVPRNDATQTSMASFDSDDSTIAGRAFYRRCQTLLSTKIETPSILTMQCQIFSAVYLRNASFVNMAHSTLALAIQTAHTLGLHQEPHDHCSRVHKELRRRLWWTVHALESTACMALGRPWLSHMSQVNCALPADDQELALFSGPSFASSFEDITWLSYHVQSVKMILAARAVQAAFERKCAQVLSASDEESFHGNPQSLELLAGFLLQSLPCLRTWVQNIPDALKTERRDGGKPFSTDRSALQVDLEAPQWLQRQRLLLELGYHDLMMNLYRPFITFAKPPSSPTLLADGNSISCLNHAIASTNIILQILKGTDILNGWHEAYHFQWNATLTMVGFIFANPVCPPTPTARRTINKAIDVFEMFRNNFAVAASAANVTCDLAVKADSFLDRFRTRSALAQQTPVSTAPITTTTVQSYKMGKSTSFDVVPQIDPEGDSVMDQTVFSGVMGVDFANDSFSGFEWSSSAVNGTNTEMWPPFVGGE